MIHPSMLSNTNLLIGFYASNCLSSEDITTVIFFLKMLQYQWAQGFKGQQKGNI